MRVVFDTNVFVSALIFPGGQGERALLRVIEGPDDLLISRAIVGELLEVLARKFARNREELARVAVFLDDVAVVITTKTKIDALRDEADNRILECAVDGEADIVVTGDKRMLELGLHARVQIIGVRDYLALP